MAGAERARGAGRLASLLLSVGLHKAVPRTREDGVPHAVLGVMVGPMWAGPECWDCRSVFDTCEELR